MTVTLSDDPSLARVKIQEQPSPAVTSGEVWDVTIRIHKTWHGRRVLDEDDLAQMDRRWPPEDDWVAELEE